MVQNNKKLKLKLHLFFYTSQETTKKRSAKSVIHNENVRILKTSYSRCVLFAYFSRAPLNDILAYAVSLTESKQEQYSFICWGVLPLTSVDKP